MTTKQKLKRKLRKEKIRRRIDRSDFLIELDKINYDRMMLETKLYSVLRENKELKITLSNLKTDFVID